MTSFALGFWPEIAGIDSLRLSIVACTLMSLPNENDAILTVSYSAVGVEGVPFPATAMDCARQPTRTEQHKKQTIKIGGFMFLPKNPHRVNDLRANKSLPNYPKTA